MESAVIAKAEAALREIAREHTKLSFAHRKTAAKLHRAADELRKALAPLGINVTTGTDEKESKP